MKRSLGCKLGYLPKFRSAYLTCARFKIQIWISWILNHDHKLCSIHSQPWSLVSHLTCYRTIQTHQRSIKGDIIYMYSQWLLVIHFKESLYKRIEAMQYDQMFNIDKKSQRWKSLCAHRSANVHNEPEGPVTSTLYQPLRSASEAGRVELRASKPQSWEAFLVWQPYIAISDVSGFSRDLYMYEKFKDPLGSNFSFRYLRPRALLWPIGPLWKWPNSPRIWWWACLRIVR